MSESFVWNCGACARQYHTRRNSPPPGWAWAHYYSDKLKAPCTILGCSADHATAAAKKHGRVTKLEIIS